MTGKLIHHYPFDPSYDYSLDGLLNIDQPTMPDDFVAFWQQRYRDAIKIHPKPSIAHTGIAKEGFEIYDLSYQSTGGLIIRGWVLIPQNQLVKRGLVIGHGYGGCDGPTYSLKPDGTALLFLCFRGLALSQHPPISPDPVYHVLHDIDKPEQYILGGCVEDIWLAVSAMECLFPATRGHIGYAGISFSGGVGALALPWDTRIKQAHLNVPSFGHHPLRLSLPTNGSAASVQQYEKQHGNSQVTLQYYDAASAANFIDQPVHVAAALFDPMVAPPGQFSIYNALKNSTLFVLDAGHFDYPQRELQEQALQKELLEFFSQL